MNSEEITKNHALNLEDIYLGQKFFSDAYPIPKAEMVDFARKYDPQIFHTDENKAKDTFFQGIAASGWYTASISMKLLVNSLPIIGGLIGAGCEVNWPRPTRENDILRLETEVIAIRPSKSKPDRGIVSIQCLTYNQNDEIVQRLISKIVVFKKNMARNQKI